MLLSSHQHAVVFTGRCVKALTRPDSKSTSLQRANQNQTCSDAPAINCPEMDSWVHDTHTSPRTAIEVTKVMGLLCVNSHCLLSVLQQRPHKARPSPFSAISGMCACVSVCACVCLGVCMAMCDCVCAHTCLCICVRVCICVSVFCVCAPVCTRVSVCLCAHMCVYVCLLCLKIKSHNRTDSGQVSKMRRDLTSRRGVCAAGLGTLLLGRGSRAEAPSRGGEQLAAGRPRAGWHRGRPQASANGSC